MLKAVPFLTCTPYTPYTLMVQPCTSKTTEYSVHVPYLVLVSCHDMQCIQYPGTSTSNQAMIHFQTSYSVLVGGCLNDKSSDSALGRAEHGKKGPKMKQALGARIDDRLVSDDVDCRPAHLHHRGLHLGVQVLLVHCSLSYLGAAFTISPLGVLSGRDLVLALTYRQDTESVRAVWRYYPRASKLSAIPVCWLGSQPNSTEQEETGKPTGFVGLESKSKQQPVAMMLTLAL
ncbi:hypothetical protein V8C37DRAFT_307287 [Trichoderma ceciliae]